MDCEREPGFITQAHEEPEDDDVAHQQERRQFLRSSGGMLFSLLASSILAACGANTTSAPSPTATSTAPSPTATSTTKVSGEFAAKDLTTHTYVGLSTDGQHVIAYACDGDQEHAITFSHWFTGTVTRNMMDLTNAEGAHLVAPLMPGVATGRVTLPDGKSFRFTANAQTDSRAGLFRSTKDEFFSYGFLSNCVDCTDN